MSKLITRIEKDFFLKILYDERAPLTYRRDRVEREFVIAEPPKDSLVLKAEEPLGDLAASGKIALTFICRGAPMLFETRVIEARKDELVCAIPESIRGDLSRTHLRVALPPCARAMVSFRGERYSLPLPRLRHYHAAGGDASALHGLKTRVESLAAANDYGYKMAIFVNDSRPSSVEEKLLAHTGKTLFMPKTGVGLPKTDPYGRGNRIVTEDVFRRYILESAGLEGQPAERIITRFLHDKAGGDVVSDAWLPILFQEYVVGYIRLWSEDRARPPLDYATLDALQEYAEALAEMLKEKGYFDQSKMENAPFRAVARDISLSGLLFTCPDMDISTKFMPGCEIIVTVATADRSLDIQAAVTRQYRGPSPSLFIACQFKNMSREETQYLFELIYAKPFEGAAPPS
ncbi:MAG: PilZ domain-containing protein [Treponema sp.]|nr:PilZ domain-containing protein [Treponema sp.]